MKRPDLPISMVRPLKIIAAAIGLLLTVSIPASSQVLTVEPGCGKPGDSFTIGGSGWAEPAPVCEYLFYFDGTEFAPRQPDGLFGPPNRTATVPAVPAGDHEVKVELRLTSDGTLLQCRQTKFKVVTAVKDPWDGNVTTPGGNSVSIEFDPTDVCDVTPCSKIALIQTVENIGEKADGTTINLTYSDYKTTAFGPPATRNADLVGATTIDYQLPAPEPYYQTAGPTTIGMFGIQNGSPKSSTMTDGPNLSDGAYPDDITKVIWNFEVAAFCAGGTNKGEFLGTVTWKWERPKGGSITVTTGTPNRNQPSQTFIEALNKWNTNHGFTLPTKTPPTTGGEACK
jgi:hypothetical protein